MILSLPHILFLSLHVSDLPSPYLAGPFLSALHIHSPASLLTLVRGSSSIVQRVKSFAQGYPGCKRHQGHDCICSPNHGTVILSLCIIQVQQGANTDRKSTEGPSVAWLKELQHLVPSALCTGHYNQMHSKLDTVCVSKSSSILELVNSRAP